MRHLRTNYIDYAMDQLEIDTNNLNTVILFPNPTKDQFKLSGIDTGSVQVFDMQGKLLKQYKDLPESKTIDISEFANGLYLLNIENEWGSKTFKIIKE